MGQSCPQGYKSVCLPPGVNISDLQHKNGKQMMIKEAKTQTQRVQNGLTSVKESVQSSVATMKNQKKRAAWIKNKKNRASAAASRVKQKIKGLPKTIQRKYQKIKGDENALPASNIFGNNNNAFENATNQPATNQPATNQSATNQPATNQPATNQSATNQPATNQPGGAKKKRKTTTKRKTTSKRRKATIKRKTPKKRKATPKRHKTTTKRKTTLKRRKTTTKRR
jgi:hypothetical protein